MLEERKLQSKWLLGKKNKKFKEEEGMENKLILLVAFFMYGIFFISLTTKQHKIKITKLLFLSFTQFSRQANRTLCNQIPNKNPLP
jgi:hypothetical protein